MQQILPIGKLYAIQVHS